VVALGLLTSIPVGLSAQQTNPAGEGAIEVLGTLARTGPFQPTEVAGLLRRATQPGQAPAIEVAGEQIALDAASQRLLGEVAALPRTIEAVDVRSKSHVMLVDAKGAIHLVDLAVPRPTLVLFHPPFSKSEAAMIDATYRDIVWYRDNGWDPPPTESHALKLGIPFESGILRNPPKPWIAVVPTEQPDPNSQCSLYTIRNGGMATLFSVCRVAKGFVRRKLAHGPFARILGARDASIAAVETEGKLILVAAAGREIAQIPAKNPGLGWIGATDLLVYGNDLGQRDSVIDSSTGASRPVLRCDSTALEAIDRFEAGAPGKRAAFLLVDGQVVEWDEARGCAVET
jgi:hypothetical protein